MSKRILVTGANGQLGSELKLSLSNYTDKVIYTDVDSLDITSLNTIRDFVCNNKVSEIVNCAVYIAEDKAEEEHDLADKINPIAVKNLAIVACEQQIRLIQIFTDYVLSGTGHMPYTELDQPDL